MITKIREFIRDTWPVYLISAASFAIMWIIIDVSERHASYKYRVKYTLGKYSVTDYTNEVQRSPGKLEFMNTTGELVQINGEFVIIKQK